MIQTRRSLNTIDSIITPSFDRRNIRNIRVKFSSFWFLVERCSMPFLHELTGMWVQAAACADVLVDFIHQNGTMPSARASEICTTLLLHSSKTTAHCCSPRGYQPRAGRRCPFALFELCQCGRICAEIFRALLGHAMIGAGTAGRAPVAVFKAGRLRIWCRARAKWHGGSSVRPCCFSLASSCRSATESLNPRVPPGRVSLSAGLSLRAAAPPPPARPALSSLLRPARPWAAPASEVGGRVAGPGSGGGGRRGGAAAGREPE